MKLLRILMAVIPLHSFGEYSGDFEQFLDQEISSLERDLAFIQRNMKDDIDIQQYYFIFGQVYSLKRLRLEYLKSVK